MSIKLKEWNILDHLKTPEEMTLYLEACLEEAGEDSEFIVNALCEIAKAKHLTSLTGSDAMWVMVLNLRGLKDLGGLAKRDNQPILNYHPDCTTTGKFI